MSNWVYIYFLLGLCSLAVSIFNWEWYYTYLMVPGIIRLIGRKGARLMYALLGLALVGLGLAGMFGVVR